MYDTIPVMESDSRAISPVTNRLRNARLEKKATECDAGDDYNVALRTPAARSWHWIIGLDTRRGLVIIHESQCS